MLLLTGNKTASAGVDEKVTIQGVDILTHKTNGLTDRIFDMRYKLFEFGWS